MDLKGKAGMQKMVSSLAGEGRGGEGGVLQKKLTSVSSLFGRGRGGVHLRGNGFPRGGGTR